MDPRGSTGHVALPEAASMLRLAEDVVVALVDAGYLHRADDASGAPSFLLSELKGLLARLDGSADDEIDLRPDDDDPLELLDVIEGRSEEMARRAFGLLVAVFPEAAAWTITRQAQLIGEASERFEAIVAVAAQGDAVDPEVLADLAAVGVAAAREGTPLPQLLLVLRISRDLVVQTAVEVAEERGRRWGLALSLVLTRVLPAVDRLTDAIARGYWQTVVERAR